MILTGRFDLAYAIISLSIFSAAPREGHLELVNKAFGYMEKYPKREYAINPQPMTINMEYNKVELKMDFGKSVLLFTGIDK